MKLIYDDGIDKITKPLMGTAFLTTILKDKYDCPPTIYDAVVISTLVIVALFKTSFINGYVVFKSKVVVD